MEIIVRTVVWADGRFFLTDELRILVSDLIPNKTKM